MCCHNTADWRFSFMTSLQQWHECMMPLRFAFTHRQRIYALASSSNCGWKARVLSSAGSAVAVAQGYPGSGFVYFVDQSDKLPDSRQTVSFAKLYHSITQTPNCF
jgi:hypothetical protein